MANLILIEKKKNGKRVVKLFDENLKMINRAAGYTHSQLMSEVNRKFSEEEIKKGFATLNGFKLNEEENLFESCKGVDPIEKIEIISLLEVKKNKK